MEKWYKPKRHSGFKKEKSVDANVRVMMQNSDHRKNRHGRLLQVGRQAQALANVTKDTATRKKARAVADKVFEKIKED